MSEIKEISTKIVEFKGEKKNFLLWNEKFVAKAQRNKYKSILSGNSIVPTVDNVWSVSVTSYPINVLM